MQQYKYRAINSKGHSVKGQIMAANELDLERRLSNIGLDLVSAKEAKQRGMFSSKKLSNKELILLCIQMEQLDRAGVPLLDAVADIRDTADTATMRTLLAEIYESVSNGSMLSAGMAMHPSVFDNVFVGLIAAGEQTGNLADVFAQLIIHLKWVDQIRSNIKKAVMYPAVMLVMMSGIIALMMLFVVPQLAAFLTNQGFDLPFNTRALIATSHFVQHSWYYIILTPILLVVGIKMGVRFSTSFAYLWDQCLLMLPVFGKTINKIEMARFCRFLAITFRSGMGILECLDVAANVVNNRVIKEGIIAARQSVSEGASLTRAMQVSNQFPSLVIRMIKVGEESGNLDQTLENVNFFYDREVFDSVNRIIGLIQPSLTVIMGCLMLWVATAVFGPLYSSFSKLKT